MPEPRFKPCMQDQPMLLPPDIGDLVPEGSMPRVVDMVVRSIDRSTLTALYPGGGAPAHDPQMMLKVVLLAYASGIYSSRAIARATRENVGFLWICGMRPLDHCTVNRFRTHRAGAALLRGGVRRGHPAPRGHGPGDARHLLPGRHQDRG